MKAEQGFTLLEVMVALAVFALLATSVLSACQHVLQQSGVMRERVFAAWLADNHMTELRLQPPPTGSGRVIRVFAGQQWALEQRVEHHRETGLLNVELDVLKGSDSAKVFQTRGWITSPAGAKKS
ncbi:type II secretion system minor pseudopilin GspI [Pseudomonas sp. NPDC088368]|jgi:general secretion pathway protein I|uniref:type II secretion system minor pseudopilin GspI n=1 Tax=Pseudomonas sp. NPDC088368 TaxID=3364453 RepID=UPI0038029F72